MNKKAAIALSVNFIVIIIIAIVILGLSMVLFADVFNKVQEADVQLQKQYEEEIWRLLDSGGVVVAPLNTQEISRGELAKFGIGVRNILETQDFSMDVDAQTVNDCIAQDDWLRLARPTREIDTNKQEIFVIGFDVPRSIMACTYVYNVKVEDEEGNEYGTLQKLYIVAK